MSDGAEATPVIGLRYRKRLQTERQLARAALQLFAQNGYDATTIEEIAEAAQVSPRTFFRYFPSKEELLFTFPNKEHPLLFITDDRFQAALEEVHNQDDSVPDIDALGAALRTLSPDVERFRDQIAMLEKACATSAALRGRRADAVGELERWAAEILGKRHDGVDRACETTAAVAMALFRLAVIRWLDGPKRTSLATYIDEAFEHLAHPPARRTTRRAIKQRRGTS